MRTTLSILAVAAVVGLVPTAAGAQQTVHCSDFTRNPNGSWSALKPITLNGISFGPGVAFTAGVSFGGVDLASILNQQCR
jgi:hypothetical protein